MRYKFQNKDQVIEQDIQEWLSLLELAKDAGMQLVSDYTPTWALMNGKQKPNNRNPFQAVTSEDAKEMVRYLENLLATISVHTDKKSIERKQRFRHKIVGDDGKVFCVSVFLGLSNGIANFDSGLYSLEYFYGKNAEKIRVLIKFLQEGEFTIDWTPID